MKTLDKVVFIGKTAQGGFYVQIRFNIDGKGRLSITGVEKPIPQRGDAASCGQNRGCLAEIVEFAPNWDATRAAKLSAIWDEWHLNDMRAHCEHQLRDHGWELEKPCAVHDFSLTREGHKARGALHERILAECAANGSATVTPDEQEILRGPGYYTSHVETPLPGYELKKTKVSPACSTHRKEHPDGLLCEPCPTCGYKYGSQWRSEEVPTDAIDFLAGLEEAGDRSPGVLWCRS